MRIGVIPMVVLALVLFHFNIFGLGLPLIAFFCNLIFTSWAVGIFVSGLVLRNGLGAEGIVWTLMFALLPLACVYYPARVLPPWLQHVSWSLPPTYVFEGMRALLIDGVFRADLMLTALVPQRRAAGGLLCGLSGPFAQRQTPRFAARGWRISHFPVEFRGFPSLIGRVEIPISGLTHYYPLASMLRRKTGV